jgi:hypothetical protein
MRVCTIKNIQALAGPLDRTNNQVIEVKHEIGHQPYFLPSYLIRQSQKLFIFILFLREFIFWPVSFVNRPFIVFVYFLLHFLGQHGLNCVRDAGFLFVDVVKEELAGEFVKGEFGGMGVESVKLVGFDASEFEGVAFDDVLVFGTEGVFPLFDPDLFTFKYHVIHFADSSELSKILNIKELTQSNILIKSNLIEKPEILFLLYSVLVNLLVIPFGLFGILVFLVKGIKLRNEVWSVLPV